MDLFDFFYPEQAQAAHLRRIAGATARLARNRSGASQEDVEGLIRENRELRLYLTAITQLLVEKGLIRADEVQAKVLTLLPPIPIASAEEPASDNPFTDLGR